MTQQRSSSRVEGNVKAERAGKRVELEGQGEMRWKAGGGRGG